MFDSNLKSELRILVNFILEGQATDQQYRYLNDLLKSNQEAFDYYLELIEIHHAIQSCDWRIEYERLYSLQQALEEFAVYEKTAPEIELPKEKQNRELIQKVVYPPKEKRKVSKFQIGTLATAAAAMLFMALFIRYAPLKGGIEVATLADSINAKWGDVGCSMEKGTRLTTRSGKLFLREGMTELLFDNNAKVVIEGPAEFELLAEDRIDLRYGRLYATVPQEAIGFTVSTPSARIIDLGTEFGVEADGGGNTSLHVIKGKTMLIAGEKSGKISMEVSRGAAKKVIASLDTVFDIPFNANRFIRRFDSSNGSLWKGQAEINLADIVGGGNGFGTGKLDWAINPSNGEQTSICEALRKNGQSKLIPVSWSDYIDGVFTIGQGQNPFPVTSQGHLFEEYPNTSGTFWGDIVNGAKVVQYASRVPYSEFQYQGKLQGQPFGTLTNPSILMVPNMGITFDLEKIRRSLPSGLKVISFSCLYGLCDSDAEIGISDFWVLVDGRVKDQQVGLQSNEEAIPASFPLKDTDRFLTLITTDNDGIGTRDWCLFARPVLHLEMRQ